MAAAAAAYYISPRNHSYGTCFTTRKHHKMMRLSITRNSGDQGETAMPLATEQDSKAPPEVQDVPKGPPSLISTLNVEKALRGIAITDVDHYEILGIRSGCSYEEVNVAYRDKVAQVMNKGLDEEELNKELEQLKESHRILSSVEERRMYDWSLARSGKPDRYMWPFEVDITQTPTGTPPLREAEDEGPTRLVGYFAISWFLLSIALFLIFNR